MFTDLQYKLKELRCQKHLRQSQVPKLVGVNKSTISADENGLRQLSFDTLIRLANLYHVTTDYLLGRGMENNLNIGDLSTDEVAVIYKLIDCFMAHKNSETV